MTTESLTKFARRLTNVLHATLGAMNEVDDIGRAALKASKNWNLGVGQNGSGPHEGTKNARRGGAAGFAY